MISKPVTDDDFRDLIEWACCMESGPWVAGGSVRKVWLGKPWRSQDVDFFFRDQDQFDRIVSILPALGDDYRIYYDSNNAVTYKIQLRSGEDVKVQAIRKNFYPDAMSLLADFDFNISQFVSDGVQMFTTEASLEDIKSNRLRLNISSKKQLNPLRVLKHVAYGFEPDPELFIEAAKNITSGGLDELGY